VAALLCPGLDVGASLAHHLPHRRPRRPCKHTQCWRRRKYVAVLSNIWRPQLDTEHNMARAALCDGQLTAGGSQPAISPITKPAASSVMRSMTSLQHTHRAGAGTVSNMHTQEMIATCQLCLFALVLCKGLADRPRSQHSPTGWHLFRRQDALLIIFNALARLTWPCSTQRHSP
jgi:hypothetical protein